MENYEMIANIAGKAYIRQLQRLFSNLPFNIKFVLKQDSSGHYEVAVGYQNNLGTEENIALDIKHNLPKKWDDEAVKELKMFDYFTNIEKGE